MPARCRPGVLGTCARYMAPNFPAPTNPTRNGLPCASSSRSLAYRFMARFPEPLGRERLERFFRCAVLPWQLHVVILQQAIIRQALDRREVAMCDLLGSLETPDVVGNRAQAQIDVDAIPGRQVAVRRMHQAGVEQDHRPCRAFRRYDAAAFDQFADGVVIDGPERVTGGRRVMLRVEHAEFVASWNEHQRAVELVDFSQEDRHVHRAWLGHLVVVLPGAVILVPLPDVTVESHLAVDLELMHVHGFIEELPDWRDHARMAREFCE